MVFENVSLTTLLLASRDFCLLERRKNFRNAICENTEVAITKNLYALRLLGNHCRELICFFVFRLWNFFDGFCRSSWNSIKVLGGVQFLRNRNKSSRNRNYYFISIVRNEHNNMLLYRRRQLLPTMYNKVGVLFISRNFS